MAQLIFQQYEKPLWRLQKYVWILNFHFILEDIRLYLPPPLVYQIAKK